MYFIWYILWLFIFWEKCTRLFYWRVCSRLRLTVDLTWVILLVIPVTIDCINNRCNSFARKLITFYFILKVRTSIIIKIKLLTLFCTSHYGAELWDLGNKSINDVCVTWRNGLRRVWGIPMDTHSYLLAPMCNSIPSFLVRSIAVRGVYFGRMSSPLGRNTPFSCDRLNFSICNFS